MVELREAYSERLIFIYNDLLRIRRVYPRVKSSEKAVKFLRNRVKARQSELAKISVPTQLMNQVMPVEQLEKQKRLFFTEEELGITPFATDDIFPDILLKVKVVSNIVLAGLRIPIEEIYSYASYTYTFVATKPNAKGQRKIETRFEFLVPTDKLDEVGFGSDEMSGVADSLVPLVTEKSVRSGDYDYHDKFIYAGFDNNAMEIHSWDTKDDNVEDGEDVFRVAREAGAPALNIKPSDWADNKFFPFALFVQDHTYNVEKLRAAGWLPNKWWDLEVDEVVSIISAFLSSDIQSRPGPQSGIKYSGLGRPPTESQMKLGEILIKPNEEKVSRAKRIREKRKAKKEKVVEGKVSRAKKIRERLKKNKK